MNRPLTLRPDFLVIDNGDSAILPFSESEYGSRLNKLRELMFKGTTTTEIRMEAINNGMSTLYADGMLKVIRGITTFEEVYRVAKRTEQESLAFQHIVSDLDSL